MIEITGTFAPLTFSWDGTTNLCIQTRSDCKAIYDNLRDKQLSITIKECKKRRSLNANALCWKLCTEIADVLRSGKDEIYFNMLKDYGQSAMISLHSDIDVKGFFKYFDEVGRSVLSEKEFTHYRIYKGSSEYDTREMSIFLDGIVSEAKQLGIPVYTAEEIAIVKGKWCCQ